MATSNPRPSKILSETLNMVKGRDKTLSLRQISEGAGVGHQWLRALVYDRIRSPGVEKIERLREYMTGYHAARRFNKAG